MLFHQNRSAVVVSLQVACASGFSAPLWLESAEAVSARFAVRRCDRLRLERMHVSNLPSGLWVFRPNLVVPKRRLRSPTVGAHKAAVSHCRPAPVALSGPSCVPGLRFGPNGDAAGGGGDVFLLTDTCALRRWMPCL